MLFRSLAAGELAGQVVGAVLQADLFQRLHGLLLIDHRMVVPMPFLP